MFFSYIINRGKRIQILVFPIYNVELYDIYNLIKIVYFQIKG
jgi:hypothetical protein